MAKDKTTLSVADMKKAIWEKEPGAWCSDVPVIRTKDGRELATGWNADDAWRNAYDAIFGGKK